MLPTEHVLFIKAEVITILQLALLLWSFYRVLLMTQLRGTGT